MAPECVLTHFPREVPMATQQRKAHSGQCLRQLLCQQHLCEAGAALAGWEGKGHIKYAFHTVFSDASLGCMEWPRGGCPWEQGGGREHRRTSD